MHHMTPRRKTRQVDVGGIGIGGDAPVAIQSMTSTYTYDVDATVAQIRALARAGADLVRVAVPDRRDTQALPSILEQSPCPIIADVHFHYERPARRARAHPPGELGAAHHDVSGASEALRP